MHVQERYDMQYSSRNIVPVPEELALCVSAMPEETGFISRRCREVSDAVDDIRVTTPISVSFTFSPESKHISWLIL